MGSVVEIWGKGWKGPGCPSHKAREVRKPHVKKKRFSARREAFVSIAHSLPTLLDTLFPSLHSPQAPSDEDRSYHGGGKRPHIAAAERGGGDAAAAATALAAAASKDRRRRRQTCSIMTPRPTRTRAIASPPPSSTRCPGRTSSPRAEESRTGFYQSFPQASKGIPHPKPLPETAPPVRLPLLLHLTHLRPPSRRRP